MQDHRDHSFFAKAVEGGTVNSLANIQMAHFQYKFIDHTTYYKRKNNSIKLYSQRDLRGCELRDL